MTLSWQDCSEVVVGLLNQRRIPSNAVRCDLLFPGYDKLARDIISGDCDRETLYAKYGSYFQACVYAVENVNGASAYDWLTLLEKTATFYEAGVKLEKFAQRLQRGEDVDWGQIVYYAKLAEENKMSKFTPLSMVEEQETPYIQTGWEPIDRELSGIPQTGLVVVGGPTGAGKTWLFTKLAAKFAAAHPEKNVTFFSLEMLLGEIKGRFKPYNLPVDVQERILLYPHPTNVENIIAQCATIPNLGLVGIDFADLLIRGEVDPAKMEAVYKTLMLGAKELGVPIILLAQLTGYNGGVPTPDMMRWTRLAGMLGWTVWTLYNPMKDWFSGNDKEESAKRRGLPLIANTAFLCAWKMRGGFYKTGTDGKKVLRDDDPGAIMIQFRPEKGFGDKHKWYKLGKEAQ